MHGVVSMLDEKHHQYVETIWAAMEAEVGIAGVPATPYPHFSYHVAEHYDLEELARILAGFAAQTKPFTVRASGLGLFTGGLAPILYVPVVRDPHLTALHEALWPQLGPAGAGIVEYYHPDVWVPHITIAQGELTWENVPAVLQVLRHYEFEWRIAVDNVAVLYDEEANRPDQLQLRYDFTG